MTSATQYREGDDLDELLADLDAQHPGQVTVTSISYPREGGVLGFFARQRVGVHYVLDAPTAPPATPELPPPPDAVAAPRGDNAQFAQLLLQLARSKAAAAATPDETAPDETDPVRRSGRDLELRRRLAEIGVPIERIPTDVEDSYRAVAQLVAGLREPPWPPAGPGELLVVAGPGAAAGAAAQSLRTRMRLPETSVWSVSLPGVDAERDIPDAWTAATVAAQLRLAGNGPAIVVAATDTEPDDCGAWLRGVIEVLAPEALWAVVDATGKPADTAAQLARLGVPPTALVVTGAARTTSPATVWELDIPVAVLDSRPATRGTWAALLIDALDAQDG